MRTLPRQGCPPVSPLNYSAASQFSMFVPLSNGWVIGGSATASKIGSGVQSAPSDLGLSSILGQTAPAGSFTNQRLIDRRILLGLFARRTPLRGQHQFWDCN